MKNITFAKVMIGLCLIASGFLGWLDWQQYQRIEYLKDAMRPNGLVETSVREIQKLGKEYDELDQALSGDGLIGQGTPMSYISAKAQLPRINIGQVDITARTAPDKNTVDKIFTINPQDRSRHYLLIHIANFLFKLEEESSRIRVTKLVLDQLNNDTPPKPRPRLTEYPSERFSFSAEVTSRERKDGSQ